LNRPVLLGTDGKLLEKAQQLSDIWVGKMSNADTNKDLNITIILKSVGY
jgi:hypothetical protein